MDKYTNEEKLLNILKNTYENYTTDFIKDSLSEDMTYDSIWVLSQIISKKEYLEYLTPKLEAMKKSNIAINSLMVYQEGNGRPHLIFTPTKQGSFGCFTLEEKNGLIKAIHLTPHNFYVPLGYKDTDAFERFTRHGNLQKENVLKYITSN